MAIEITAPSVNESRLAWVSEAIALCEPEDVHWCDGSAEEHAALCQALVDAGTFEPLSRPGSYPGPLASRRRRARGGPHVHLLAVAARRRPDEQLA